MSAINVWCGDASSVVREWCIGVDGEALQRLADDSGLVWDRGARSTGPSDHRVRFIPSSRAMIFSDGWAPSARLLPYGYDMCDRSFSEHANKVLLSARDGSTFFGSLPVDMRNDIERLFGMRVVVEYNMAIQSRRLFGVREGEMIPYQSWRHELRVLFPLLLGVSDMLSVRARKASKSVEYVVFESPEICLSSGGVRLFMKVVLELVSNGYSVVIATNSVDILYALWAVQNAKTIGGRSEVLRVVGWPNTKRFLRIADAVVQSEIEASFVGDSSISSIEGCIESLTEYTSGLARIVAGIANRP